MMKRTASSSPTTQTETLALYVHLPWCARKCPYCDFNSFESRGAVPELDYVDALLRDLGYESTTIGRRAISSIYIGGGTPSLFSAVAIRRLLDGIASAVTVDADAEITLEANPGTLEAGRFGGFRAAGINRISIGVQSLRDGQLQRLGRVHSAAQARKAVSAALEADFDSVNLDLMYALPGDTMTDGLADLEDAIALGTPHLSWYQLTLEPNTAWERRPPAGIPADEVVGPLERRGREVLASAGLQRYEISAYARRGHECRHNLRYWRFADYIGIGAGAHSKVRTAGVPGYVRYCKRRNPQSYMAAAGLAACVESAETVAEGRAITLEYLMNGLRLVSGTSLAEFEAATGLSAASIARTLRDARRLGLLEDDEQTMRATDRGLNELNGVLRMFC